MPAVQPAPPAPPCKTRNKDDPNKQQEGPTEKEGPKKPPQKRMVCGVRSGNLRSRRSSMRRMRWLPAGDGTAPAGGHMPFTPPEGPPTADSTGPEHEQQRREQIEELQRQQNKLRGSRTA